VIKMRRAQLTFGDGLIADEVEDLREKWMTHADEVLEDEQLVATVYEALTKMRKRPKPRGSNAFAFPIAPPKAQNANASRRNAGSARVKNGGPDPRGASASPSGGTVSIAAGTKVMME
jgi:hypothetical protein